MIGGSLKIGNCKVAKDCGRCGLRNCLRFVHLLLISLRILSILSVDLVFSTVLSRVSFISPSGLVFSTVSSRVSFISPNGLMFSTVLLRILSASPDDYVFST